MISSIIGDMIGSIYEFNNDLSPDCCFMKDNIFTDDTVLTVATADVLLNRKDYAQTYLAYTREYPHRGYGSMFIEAANSGILKPYNSYGNGSMMRVGPIGWVFSDIRDTIKEAIKSANVSHNHIEGKKGAAAIAYAMLMLRRGEKKEVIKKILESKPFYYDLSVKMKDFPKTFDVTCQGTLPRCMAIFFETNSFEEAMLEGLKMGGDVDTNCCIVGSLCDASYGLPKRALIESVYERIPLKMANIVTAFTKQYIDKTFIEPTKIGTEYLSVKQALSKS